jgi:hypothetical protein
MVQKEKIDFLSYSKRIRNTQLSTQRLEAF